MLGVWAFSGRVWHDRKLWLNQPWSQPVLCIMALQICSLLWSQNLQVGLKLVDRSYYWLLGFAALSAVMCIRDIRLIAWAYLVGLSINVGLSILQFVKIVTWHHATHTYGLMGQITYSLLLVAGLLILSFLYKQASSSRYTRIVLLIALGAYFFNLTILVGRSGYIAYLVALPFILMNLHKRKSITSIVVCCIIGIAALFVSPTVRERLTLIPDEVYSFNPQAADENMGSVQVRLHMWNSAVKIFLEHPVTGVGIGGFPKAMEKHKNTSDLKLTYMHPHNSYLYIAASYGLLGIALYGWLLWILLRESWHHRETIGGWMAFSFLLVILVGSLSDTQVLSNATGMLLGLLPGLLPSRPPVS